VAKQSLLVADADPRSLRILEVALRKAGFAVATASDGAEALRKLQRNSPDALLCELHLPSEDGLSLCRTLRADGQFAGLPVLLMSADREPATRAAAMQAGADDLLPKPLSIKEVVARVRGLLSQREQERNAQRGTPSALTGTVGDLGLVDLFTSLENWQKTATVYCEGDGRSARVWVRDGQVIDAEVGTLAGEAAFYRLLNWDAGSFRVDFGPVAREPRTDAGTQALLMEGMRRIDEMARLADTLPLSTVLAVDFPRLLAHLAEIPDELNGVLRLFDGVRTMREVIAGSPLDELSTMAAVQRLLSGGVLVHGASSAPRPKPSLEQWLGSNPPPPVDRAARAHGSGTDDDLPVAELLLTPPNAQASLSSAASDAAATGRAAAAGASPHDGPPPVSVLLPPSDALETGSSAPTSMSADVSSRDETRTPRLAPGSRSAPMPGSARTPRLPSADPATPPPPKRSTTPGARSFSTDSHHTHAPRHRNTAMSVPPASVATGGTDLGATNARAGRIPIVRYAPLRGTRRERLRREAEEARQAIAAGRPIRLTHVLELPPTPGGNDAMPDGARRMSVAVGEAAKRFAPDLPIARVVGTASSPPPATELMRTPKTAAAQASPAVRKSTSQQIGAALADALAAQVDGANEPVAPVPLESQAAARTGALADSTGLSARSAPTHRSVLLVAGLGAVALAVAAAFALSQRHPAAPSATAAAEPNPNAAASVVAPPSPVASAQEPTAEASSSPEAQSPPPPKSMAGPDAPDYARAFSSGEALLKQGRYRAAIGEYRKAVESRPDSVPALTALGDAYLEADQPRNALKPLLQAAQLDPRRARVQLLLGTAFQSLGRPKDAVAAYKRYLDLDPHGEFAGDVRAIVATLSR